MDAEVGGGFYARGVRRFVSGGWFGYAVFSNVNVRQREWESRGWVVDEVLLVWLFGW
jgi:hypothetical protein